MRITFNTSTTETLEYLRLVNTILRHNQGTEDEVRAYAALKAALESINSRLSKLESANNRRAKVCR